jgi:aminopeptidase N
MNVRNIFQALMHIALLAGCGVASIHFQVYNPPKAGQYPKVTEKLLLLGAPSRFRSCFDVSYYSLKVGVNPDKKYLTGEVQITATAKTDFDTLQIDLYDNMKINFIKTDELQPLTYYRRAGAVFVLMPQRMKAGNTFSFFVSYEGKPVEAKKPPWDGGFVWKKDKNKKPWIGVACQTEGASMWWPNKDDVSDEPDSVDIAITVPQKLKAVCNGVLRGENSSPNQTITYNWHVSYPINNYNITLYVGDFKLLQDTFVSALTEKNTLLNHYVLPYNYDSAKVHFQQVKKHLAFYEKMFGEYPWQRDGFKLVESPYAGMEHQSAIAYGNGYKDDNRNNFDYIILHETAHEWWGNSVTAADLADGWLHEGFASYCEALYVEYTQGRKAYLNYLFLQRIMIRNERPVVHKRGIRYFDYHDEDIYVKGSWVLHTLRTVINNDSLFFDILKTYRLENNCKQVLSETFMELVSKKTGQNYNWFFKQYLFKRESPVFEFYWGSSGFYYRWTHVDDDFVMPIEIITSAGSRQKIYPTKKIKQKTVLASGRINFNTSEQLYGTLQNEKLPELAKAE